MYSSCECWSINQLFTAARLAFRGVFFFFLAQPVINSTKKNPLRRASNLHSGLWLYSSPALGAGLAVPLPFQPRHTGAPHGDGHVDLRVGVAAADAGAGPLQDDGRGKDGSAAELLALLLPLRSDQTALTKAVGLGDVAREPGRLIIQPKTVRNFNKRLKRVKASQR